MYSTSAACLHTVRHLTEGSAGKYSILVLDNRGAGASVIPRRRFKTSDMAQDVVALLDHVGWTQDRTVHIVGISLGGMVAQEVVSPRASGLQSGGSANPNNCLCRRSRSLGAWRPSS